MQERIKMALEKFEEGYDCSHAILNAYADLFEFDEKSMECIRMPCGPMIGKPMSVCGAVAGALKTLSQKLREEKESGNSTRKKSELIREFKERFEKIHGSVNCTDLLGVDLNDVQGQTAAMDRDLFHTKCVGFITDSALILEDLIDLKRKE
ncbi:MAG: C_GCAxxG_C_C family protein [Spirochaetaceae bacterium]|nr:MAG: C_GCAxxG_C_C family protein [Spirochaetaceae bacterium]